MLLGRATVRYLRLAKVGCKCVIKCLKMFKGSNVKENAIGQYNTMDITKYIRTVRKKFVWFHKMFFLF